MLPHEQPDRIRVAFDDHRLVANAGLLLPVTLADRLGLRELVDRHVDLGRALGRTAHPQGPPSHPASSPQLTLGKPIRQALARLRALPLLA